MTNNLTTFLKDSKFSHKVKTEIYTSVRPTLDHNFSVDKCIYIAHQYVYLEYFPFSIYLSWSL